MVLKSFFKVVLALFVMIILAFFFMKTSISASVNTKVLHDEIVYDVIVLSGEPEGVAAAVSAARNGMKVLLIEKRDGLGGLMTYGMMNYLDIPMNDKKQVVSQGIFSEWHKLVGGQNIITVDPFVAKKAFQHLVDQEKNITVFFSTKLVKPILKGNKMIGIVVERNGKIEKYFGKVTIDCSPDADLAAMAGVPFFIGQEDIGKKDIMATTLMIHLEGVNWEKVAQVVKEEQFGKAAMNKTAAWGFHDIEDLYEEKLSQTNVRGLNIGKTTNGDIYINALQIYHVDWQNPKSIETGINIGKQEAIEFVKWLNQNFHGFEKAKIKSFPNELYIRETRHILAEYQLTIRDVWENKHFWDDVAIGGYPSDVQTPYKGRRGYIVVNPNQYGIPLRSMIPKKIDQLLVASKSGGYTSLAASSARVIPTGMAVAQAAGVVASKSVKENKSIRKIARDIDQVKEIQTILKKQGQYLSKLENPDFPYKNEDYYKDMMYLVEKGLLVAGYTNNIFPDQTMTIQTAANIIANGIKQLNVNIYQNVFPLIEPYLNKDNENLTGQQLSQISEALTGKNKPELEQKTELKRKEIFPVLVEILQHFETKNQIQK